MPVADYHMYSDPEDVLVGTDLALPADDTIDRFVKDAAKEIDSRLGFKYVTPLKFTRIVNGSVTEIIEDDPSTYTPSYLLINRLSNFIASGRYILAASSPEEQNGIHQYGNKLLRDAEAILSQITSNRADLELEEIPVESNESPYGLLVSNREQQSFVQRFEDQPTNYNNPYAGAESTPSPYRNPYSHAVQVVREGRPGWV